MGGSISLTFVGRQGAFRGQNLRESLFGVFHQDEEKLQTTQMTPSGLEKRSRWGCERAAAVVQCESWASALGTVCQVSA